MRFLCTSPFRPRDDFKFDEAVRSRPRDNAGAEDVRSKEVMSKPCCDAAPLLALLGKAIPTRAADEEAGDSSDILEDSIEF